jgi:hypothetical protein
VRPVLGGMAALRAMAVPATGKVQPLVTGAPAASCTRTLHCTKPDNHPGGKSKCYAMPVLSPLCHRCRYLSRMVLLTDSDMRCRLLLTVKGGRRRRSPRARPGAAAAGVVGHRRHGGSGGEAPGRCGAPHAAAAAPPAQRAPHQAHPQ